MIDKDADGAGSPSRLALGAARRSTAAKASHQPSSDRAWHHRFAARPARQRGAALLVVMLLAAASAAVSSAVLARSSSAALELRARQDVLCARYAALAGLAMDAPTVSSAAAAAVVGPKVRSLQVTLVRRGPSWCVLRALAVCGQASRTLERTLQDPARCS